MRFDDISKSVVVGEFPDLFNKIDELNELRNSQETNMNELNVLTNDVIIEQNNVIIDLLYSISEKLQASE
nr:MAG TPA: hypothetical protein [Caudoviricetes sp.]